MNTHLLRRLKVRHPQNGKAISTTRNSLLRSLLYVPASSEKMLAKSLSVPADAIIYDLEDSVAPQLKPFARDDLAKFLRLNASRLQPSIWLRLNSSTAAEFEDDISFLAETKCISTAVLPKIHSRGHLDRFFETYSNLSSGRLGSGSLGIIASVESARALWKLGEVASWTPNRPGLVKLMGLLFAAEDYCADAGVIRTRQRTELLYARSHVVNAAKAFGLQAIDMVCVNYSDAEYLAEEALEGRRLGFTGKQAIHPSQVDVINRAFVPNEAEIIRAAKIVSGMKAAHNSSIGAIGLERQYNRGLEMIDEPMIKQALKTIEQARSAGLMIPKEY